MTSSRCVFEFFQAFIANDFMHVVPFAPLSYHESANCILCSPEPPQEFQEKNWGTKEEDGEDAVMFEEDWDDTEINDDFTNQLRKELAKK